jgi:phosphatidylinositol glycan class N
MFSKGAARSENNSTKVFTEMYDTSFEDFSSKDLSQLDTWVFDKVEQFFERAASDPDLQMKLRQDKIVLVIFNRIFGCLGVNVLFRAD